MKDIMGMMKKAQELQERAQEMQAEAAATIVEGSSGGGLVTVTLTGKGEMRASRSTRRCSRTTMSKCSRT